MAHHASPPPAELRPMFNASGRTLLQRQLPLDGEFVCRTLRTVGIGESQTADRIGKLLQPLIAAGMDLGLLRAYRRSGCPASPPVGRGR